MPLLKKNDEPTVELKSMSNSSLDTLENNEALLRSAYRKVDKRLVLWYTFVLLVLKIESFNIIAASILNLEQGTDIKTQLGIKTGVQWAMIISAFAYTHMAFEPISTLFIKWFTPRKWMSRIMITWGIISMCTAATKNFGGLFACRLLLGLAEAGFMPGALYHLSFWYPAERLPLRIALLCALSTLAAGVSGLLAYGISFMNSLAGLAGWRWLFLIEGAPAVLCGIYTMFRLPNYPDTATFLSSSQREAVQEQLPKSRTTSEQKFSWSQVKALLKDWTTYTFLLIWICHVVGAFGISTVLPNVVYQLGLTNTAVTQLMIIPPAVLGGIVLLIVAWLVRKKKVNAWYAAGTLECLTAAFYGGLLAAENPVTRYVLMVLALIFAIGVLPLLWPERIKATDGTTSAALAIGLTTAATSTHGILGPHIYLERFAPSYNTSFEVSLGLLGLSILSIGLTKWLLSRR